MPTSKSGACMQICAYEDRVSEEVGVRLLVTSFAAHNPHLTMRLFYPVADDLFIEWIRQFPNVRLDRSLDLRGMGWNAKPSVLLRMLEDGAEEVVWIDSDIIVTRPIATLFESLSPNVIAISEEALWGKHSDGDADRARAWGFDVGRRVPFTLNTGVLRVTSRHACLIEEWRRLLQTPEYQAAQKLGIMSRPMHLLGDQEVLTALLCRSDFAGFPLRYLRRGDAILQIFGLKAFTIRERWLALTRGLPPFIHSQQFKPWRQNKSFGLIQAAYLQTSPYIFAAKPFARVAGVDFERLRPSHPLGRALLWLSLGNPALAGLPIAVVVDVGYPVGRALKRLRRAPGPAGADHRGAAAPLLRPTRGDVAT